ncbi:MAG TPA: hemolysin III family protein [Chryseosolibacter sp.]
MEVVQKREEIANAITHGIGTGLSIAALVLLAIVSAIEGTASHVIGFTIFGATLVILYLASTLYHSMSNEKVKRLFRKFDHMSIFLLIAGTYTPFCLTALPGWVGWTVLSIVWACAITGIVMKAFHTGKFEGLSTFLYVVMGWLIIPAIKPLYDSVSFQTFLLLILGGVFYTSGTFFFVKDNNRYYHSIWHLFVLAGSTLHFFSVISLLV